MVNGTQAENANTFQISVDFACFCVFVSIYIQILPSMSSSSLSVCSLEGVNAALIYIRNPPLNLVTAQVRNCIRRQIDNVVEHLSMAAGTQQERIDMIVVTGARGSRCFSAGADISEFQEKKTFLSNNGSDTISQLSELCNALELRTVKFGVPVIACLNSQGSVGAVGGGLEIAMSCHYRVAINNSDSKAFAMPEVKLGLVPGAGGTQRLPRLVGAERALSLVTKGEWITACEAYNIGLIDLLVPEPAPSVDAQQYLIDAAIRFGCSKLTNFCSGAMITVVRHRQIPDGDAMPEILRRYRRAFCIRDTPSMSGVNDGERTLAIAGAIDAIEAAGRFSNDFDRGLTFEAAVFRRLSNTTQARALQHMFAAERKVQRSSVTSGANDVKKVGIIGGGMMGAGIAVCLLRVGIKVVLVENSDDHVRSCSERVSTLLLKKNKGNNNNLEHFYITTVQVASGTYSPYFDDVDLVVEAVSEDLETKQKVFAGLACTFKQWDTHRIPILATNTSSLSIDTLALSCGADAALRSKIIGMHFFSPAHIMKLVEVVRGTSTDGAVLQTVTTFLKLKLKKIPVVVHNSGSEPFISGFVANRIFARGMHSAMCLLEDGTSDGTSVYPSDIDAVMCDFGYPMGPFAMQDLVGLDVVLKIRLQSKNGALPMLRDTNAILERLVSSPLCRLGRKVSKGWYRYSGEAGHQRLADDEVHQVIDEFRKPKSPMPIPFKSSSMQQEILEKILLIIVNEAARIVEAGVVRRPSDIDVIFVHGFGFPRYRGGPCFWADTITICKVVELMWCYHYRLGPRTFPAPCDFLLTMAAQGKNFDSLNAAF